jgi:hypothetical protein
MQMRRRNSLLPAVAQEQARETQKSKYFWMLDCGTAILAVIVSTGWKPVPR